MLSTVIVASTILSGLYSIMRIQNGCLLHMAITFQFGVHVVSIVSNLSWYKTI